MIHGYVVVRIPRRSFDEQQRGAYVGGPPCRGTRCYRGFDRMPWFDIDEAFYASGLPAPLRELRRRIEDANSDVTGIHLCPSRAEAFELLRFSNQSDDRCELIAISSAELARMKGPAGHGAEVEWIGYDVKLLGGWSPIGDWIFRSPADVRGWLDRLNEHGLLDSPDESASLVADYGRAVERGEAEEIPTPEWRPIVLRIGLVKADGVTSLQG